MSERAERATVVVARQKRFQGMNDLALELAQALDASVDFDADRIHLEPAVARLVLARLGGPSRRPQGRLGRPIGSTASPVTGLSAIERAVLGAIKEHIESHGYPPSVRDIGAATGLSSGTSVLYRLKQLERKGFIRRDSRRPRAIEVLPELAGGEQ